MKTMNIYLAGAANMGLASISFGTGHPLLGLVSMAAALFCYATPTLVKWIVK